MPDRLTWRNLIIGIAALSIVLLLGAGVLLFAGVGRVRGAKMHLYVATSQARGVMRGTEVWVSGQKVGVVDGVDFRPPSADTSGRLVIALTVKKNDAEQIRRDATAQVRAGANFIGPVVVYIDAGTPAAPPVREGDTLRAATQSDLEVAAVKMRLAMQDVSPLMADARAIAGKMRDRNGTVGALLSEGFADRPEVSELRVRVAKLRQRLFGGGPVARSRDVLFARAQLALARVDSVRALLASPRTSFGRYRRDSTLMREVARLRDDLGALGAQLDSADGTIGRLKTDSALANAVTSARGEMAALFEDIRRRPLHYVYF